MKKGNIEKVERQVEKQQQIASHIKDTDTYNVGVGKNENSDLLAFKNPSDDEREDRGGFRKRRDYGDDSVGGFEGRGMRTDSYGQGRGSRGGRGDRGG